MSTEPRSPSALIDVEACGLHKRTPYGITNVTRTQFSIARFSGGCTFNGDRYIYLPQTDELIREDVLKWQQKQKKEQARQAKRQQRGQLKLKL